MSVLAYWYNLLVLLKMIKAISQSHSTDSSYAFFMTPNLRLLNVTCRFRSSVIREICIFFRPILPRAAHCYSFPLSAELLLRQP